MKPEHHGFSRVFRTSLSLNPGVAFKVPFKPLLFHIVRGQHMMPNVIRGWCDWCHLSSEVFNSRRLFRTAAQCQQGSMEATELNACSHCCYAGYAGFGASRVIRTLRSW